MTSPRVQDEQRDLIARVYRTVRWLKRRFGYAGSKHTADFGAMVFTRLARNTTTRQLLESDPTRLRGLVKTVAQQSLFDELRKPTRERLALDGAALVERGHDEQWTPPLQRSLAGREQVQQVRRELAHFLSGDGSEKFRAQSRPSMVRAFELFYFEDCSQPEIAQRLAVSRNTVMVWIDCMTLHIARRIAQGSVDDSIH